MMGEVFINDVLGVTNELPENKLNDACIEKFLANQNATEEQKDLFRLFIRVEKSRRQVAC